ncbi:MAG: Xaa-Pro peptidase family protein [Chloroflexota bacterium]
MSEALLLVGDSYSDQDLFYKTRFLAGDPFIYVENDSSAILVTAPMEAGRAAKESCVHDVRTFDDFGFQELLDERTDRDRAFGALVARVVLEAGADSAVGNGWFRALHADALRAEGIHLRLDPTLVHSLRRHKKDDELAAMEKAQRATERAMNHAVGMIGASEEHHGILHYGGIPLTSERLRGEIELLLMREGMDSAHAPIVAGGKGAADPHWEGHGALHWGEAIVLDIFPRSKETRYFADMTRTVVKGDVDDQLRAMYAAVRQAQDTALDQIRAGANGRDVHEAVSATLRSAGFDQEGSGPRYIHGTGHGLGLDVHERPTIGARGEELLEGDVVTVEPGLYDPEIGGVRIEDVVVVTADGCRNLTQFPKQFEL